MLHVEWHEGVVTFTVDNLEDILRIKDSDMVNQAKYFADMLNKYVACGKKTQACYMVDCLVAMCYYLQYKTVPVLVYEDGKKVLVFYRWDIQKYVTTEDIPVNSKISAISEIIAGERPKVNNYKNYTGVCPTCGKKLVVAPPKKRGHPFTRIISSCSCGSEVTLLKGGG